MSPPRLHGAGAAVHPSGVKDPGPDGVLTVPMRAVYHPRLPRRHPFLATRQADDSAARPRAAASGACSDEDVDRLFHVFLGRAPEPSDMASCHRASWRDVADALIASPAFASRIHAICAGSPDAATDSPLSGDIIEWLQLRIGVDLEALGGTGAVSALAALLKTDLSLWMTFRKTFGRRAPGLLDQLMAPPAVATTRWTGFIEVCTEYLIQGWVVRAPYTGPVRLALYVNGMLLATTEASLFRPDVAGTTGHSGVCGFHLRPRLGPYLLRQPRLVLTLRDADTGRDIPLSSEMTCVREHELMQRMPAVAQGDHAGVFALSSDDPLVNFVRASAMPIERYAMFRALHRTPPPPQRSDEWPTISVIVCVTRATQTLPAVIANLHRQTYPRWEAVLVAGGREADTAAATARQALHDPRIVVVARTQETDEAVLRNVGIEAASGEYVWAAHEDDVLDPEALGWIAHAADSTRPEVLYTDHAAFEAVAECRRLVAPQFKPAFDYDLLLATQYASFPLFVARDAARAVGGFRAMPARASDIDLLLRLIEHAATVVHVPLVLVDRPSHAAPSVHDEPVDSSAIDDAIGEHLRRTGAHAVLAAPAAADFVDGPRAQRRVQWLASRTEDTLAIIIATRNRVDLLQPCIESLRRTLAVPSSTEIVIVDNRSDDPLTVAYLASLHQQPGVRVLPFPEEFNWSRANNLAVASTNADLLLFMNNDMEMITPAFDVVVRGLLDRPDVGAVGALLLYDDGSIQHAGTATGVGGTAAHMGVGCIPGGEGCPEMHVVAHGVGAVTGAFLATRRTVFECVGGFDEAGLKVTFNDVDLCLKLRTLGKTIVYTPAVRCFHYESATRGADDGDPVHSRRAERESALLAARWREELTFDPFYNPSFCRDAAPHSGIRMPSASTVTAYLERQVEWMRRWRSDRILPTVPQGGPRWPGDVGDQRPSVGDPQA